MARLKPLNKQQKQAVTHEAGPLLVVAGAGTGKTEVITRRIAHLIKHKQAKPSEVLAVTFTEKAAREMETRVSEVLEKYVLDVNVTTFNSFGHDLLRRFAYDIGLSPEVTLLNQNQSVLFLRDHIEELKLKYYSPVTNPEKFLGSLAAYFSKLKTELVTPNQYTKFVQKQAKTKTYDRLELRRQQELAAAYEIYQRLMSKYNLIDFEDQIYLSVQLLEQRPNIQKRLAQEIKWILVDEFQDTNPAQSRLIDLLASKPANLTVVGDDDQSIYHFRGAAVSNILQFKQRYPKAKIITLAQNYRSTQAILDTAYKLIQHNNPDRLESNYAIDKRLIGVSGGKAPRLKHFSEYETEAAWVAGDIKHHLDRGAEPGSIAILIRKNNQASLIARNLETSGIDYLVAGEQDDLYKQPMVKLLLQFLQAIVDPGDSANLYHLLCSQIYNIDRAWLREQAATARRQHLPLEKQLQQYLEEARDIDEKTIIQEALAQIKTWREELSNLSVGQLCYQVLDGTGQLSQLVKRATSEPQQERHISDLRQFFSSLREYEIVAQDDTAIGYVDSLGVLTSGGNRLAIEDMPEVFGDKVRIMTIHKAKGLEFETVYLFDMTQGTFPSPYRGGGLEIPHGLLSQTTKTASEEQLQEERRLCYVSITRAKHELVASFSFDHGGKIAKKPSRFLAEAFDLEAVAPQLSKSRDRVQQIELFKPRAINQALLPPSIWQGDNLMLTARQIEDYLLCPAEFYLRHVIAPPQPPSVALEYGNLMHSAVQLYNQARRDNQSLKLESLLAYIRDNWPAEGYLDLKHKHRALKQAESSIKRFYRREQAAKSYPRYVEKPFELKMKDLKLTVRGRIDAVYDDNKLEIRDYKTGSPHIEDQEKADKRAKDSKQLGVYALAWHYLEGRIPEVLSLDFLDSGFIGISTRTPKQLDSLADKICQVAEGLRKFDFTPASSHIFCSHQEYGF